MRHNSPQRGFTLIELLVTIAVMAVLVALIMPAVQYARESARRADCQNRLKQIGLALHNYHEAHSTLPPGSISMGPSFPLLTGWGWGAMILPHLDQSPLYQQIDFGLPNLAPANQTPSATYVPTFSCPSDIAPEKVNVTFLSGSTFEVATGNYLGNQFLLDGISSIRLSQVTDGLSQTLLMCERIYIPGVPALTIDSKAFSGWCGVLHSDSEQSFQSIPAVAPVNIKSSYGIVGVGASISSRHAGGAQFTLADGSVRFISEQIDRAVLQAISTPNGGESVSSF